MLGDFEQGYRAVQSRDSRFDGWFYTAVTSTGIYCRPSCPAVTPRRSHVRFYPTAAAAQTAGFRACKRCRPDATPGSPAWNARADLVGRAMRLIADGVVERDGVTGLARRLAVSERHLHRQLVAEVGAGPLALARAQRAHTARLLLETTTLSVGLVAFAAGFASVRQFNDTVRAVFAATPSDLRRAANAGASAPPGTISLRLPYRAPCDVEGLLRFLGARGVPGIEAYDEGVYRRTLRLPHGTGIVALESPGRSAPAATGRGSPDNQRRGRRSGNSRRDGPAPTDGFVRCTLRLDDPRDLGTAVQRCRRLLDLDADPRAVGEVLGEDPTLAPLVAQAPGLRVPGCVDGAELAVRAVLGQQVSVAGARTLAGRLLARFGTPLATPDGSLTHLFPEPAALAEADLAVPQSRQRALRALATALAEGTLVLDAGADRGDVERKLLALPGIGPWTAAYVAMRALGDPDAFPLTDLGVKRAAERLGLPTDPAAITAHAERWRPWRAYATQHLWASLSLPAPAATGQACSRTSRVNKAHRAGPALPAGP